MDLITVNAYISAPREAIYDYVADLANRPAFMDGYAQDFRLAHPRSAGRGAAARYLLAAPLNHHWVETTVVEAERPRRIVERTHGGRNGKSKGGVSWEFARHGQGLTRVSMTTWNEPGMAREAVMEKLGTAGWTKRRAKQALERLRVIFEERKPGPDRRATVAGYEPMRAPRFGASTPVVRG